MKQRHIPRKPSPQALRGAMTGFAPAPDKRKPADQPKADEQPKPETDGDRT